MRHGNDAEMTVEGGNLLMALEWEQYYYSHCFDITSTLSTK